MKFYSIILENTKHEEFACGGNFKTQFEALGFAYRKAGEEWGREACYRVKSIAKF